MSKKVKVEKEIKEPKPKKKKAGYIDNERFLELLIERKATKDILEGELSAEERLFNERLLTKNHNEIGKMLILIAGGLMKRPNFINYPPDQQIDMISDAIYCMAKFLDKYDTQRTNPFAYFSQISWNAFLQSIGNMKKRVAVMVNVEYVDNYDTMSNDLTDSFE